jgi:hypothetical protein
MKKLNSKLEVHLVQFKSLIQKKKLRLTRLGHLPKIQPLLSETNFNQDSFNFLHSQKPFEFGYQRINLNLKFPGSTHPYLGLGRFSKEKYSCFFSFTNTGQSAVSAALMVARRIYGPSIAIPNEGCYFETYDFLKDFSFSIFKPNSIKRPSIFLLDTSTQNRINELQIQTSVRLVVIDTTCLSLQDKTLRKFIDVCTEQDIEVCLVRSHIKIDCFGSEYGRLGSLFYIAGRNSEKLKNFRINFNAVAGPFGLRCQLNQIYPFFNIKQFHELNENWLMKIRSMNSSLLQKLVEKIDKNKIQIISFDHSLFAWIVFLDLKLVQLQKLEKKLILELNRAGISAFSMASYPWDTHAILKILRPSVVFQ